MHVLLVKRLLKNLIFYFNLSVSKTEQLVETSSNIENNKVVSLKEVTLKHKGKKTMQQYSQVPPQKISITVIFQDFHSTKQGQPLADSLPHGLN